MLHIRVCFSGDGFDCNAYFQSFVDANEFAKLMAKDGRLVRVVDWGKDITDRYVDIVPVEEVIAR